MSAVVADTYAFERQLTRFDPQSELSRFNAAAGTRVAVSPLLAELLRVCLDAYDLSDGLVNAACLPALIDAGYDRTITEVRRHPVNRRSYDTSTSKCRHCPTCSRWGIRGHDLRRAALSTSAVSAKGGSPTGSASASTTQRSTSAVTFAPAVPDQTAQAGQSRSATARCVTVQDAGIATSGTSARRWPGGHHLIDPRTGVPAQTDISEISVIANTALHAEILAKGACLLGNDAAVAWLQRRGAARQEIIRSMQPH